MGNGIGPILNQFAVIPGHNELYGRAATRDELLVIVRRYAVGEWLSYVSRIQNMLSADRATNQEHVQRVLAGTISRAIHAKLIQFEQRHTLRPNLGLYYERQMSTLQQFAVVHAPNTAGTTFESEQGRHDLSLALLMTMDLMNEGRVTSGLQQAVLPTILQDQIRMCQTSAAHFATRAYYFYELDRDKRSESAAKYLELFEIATGAHAVDFFLGGLEHVIHEETNREKTERGKDLAWGWTPIRQPHHCESANEARCLEAYQHVRMRSMDQLRELIVKWDGEHPIRDWNLIALSQAPICDFGDRDAFVLNHTVLGRSLFDGVRHAILTAALDGKLSPPYSNEKAIGDLHGALFQSYVVSLLRDTFPDRVFEIPPSGSEQRADVLVLFPNIVVIIEIKTVHFVSRNHASYLTLDKRRDELRERGVYNAVKQLAASIKAIRKGRLLVNEVPNYDWTITPIVPLIVTEDALPLVPGCWELLYESMTAPLSALASGCPVGRLRFLHVDDVELLPDLQTDADFGTMLYQWGASHEHSECSWRSFVKTREGSFRKDTFPRKYFEVIKCLARRLGLDEAQLRSPDQRAA